MAEFTNNVLSIKKWLLQISTKLDDGIVCNDITQANFDYGYEDIIFINIILSQ